MKSISRLALVAVMSLLFLLSCKKKIDRKVVEKNLISAMDQYLNHQPGIDTTHLKFKVLDVDFFEDPKFYICEFQVNMKRQEPQNTVDTTGKMRATVSLDFQKVARSY